MKIAGAVFGILVLTAIIIFVALFFLCPPDVPTGPAHMVRGADGQMTSTDPSENTSGFSFDFHVEQMSSSNIFGSSSSSSTSGCSPLACSRIVILNKQGGNLLMARVGRLLINRLGELPWVGEIDYYPPDSNVADGCPAPDVIVTLDLPRLEESSGLIEHKLDADIAVRAGTSLLDDAHVSYIDNLTPPAFHFDWNGQLRHSSTVSGATSASVKYKSQAEDIAEQIGDKLLEEFKQWKEKYGLMPQLPAAFYPPYRPLDTLPWQLESKAEKLASWHGFMNHNDSYYRLTIEGSAADALAQIERQLKDKGWKTSDFRREPAESAYLRMSRGSAVFEIFPQRKNKAFLSPEQPDPLPAAPGDGHNCVVAHYTDRMSAEELSAAIDETILPETPLDTILLFEHFWSREQGRKVLDLLASRRPVSAQGWLAAANLLHRQKQDEEAKAALMRANIMRQTEKNDENSKSNITSLAKELGIEKSLDQPADVKLLRELGFVELKPGVDIEPREIALDELACFFGVTSQGDVTIITLRITATGIASGQPTYGLTVLEKKPSSSSWSSGGIGAASAVIDGTCRATFSVAGPDSAKKFHVTATVSNP
jgi:hypothetical protein